MISINDKVVAWSTLDWLITINNVTHAGFNDEAKAREYYQECVKVTKDCGVKDWIIKLLSVDDYEFTNHETFKS